MLLNSEECSNVDFTFIGLNSKRLSISLMLKSKHKKEHY